MTLVEVADKLARALVEACDEHGLPNAFTFGELADHYRGPHPMLAGLAARRYRERLEEALRASGYLNVKVQIDGRLLSVTGTTPMPAPPGVAG